MAGENEGNKGAKNVGLTADAITNTINKALENWSVKQKPAEGDKDKKAPNTEDLSKILNTSISTLMPDLTKKITEEATKTASETFKAQHYGEIDKLTTQIKTLTDAKAATDTVTANAKKTKEQEDFNKLDETNQVKVTLSKQSEVFTNQMSQITDALGQITNRLNKNDMTSYRTSLLKDDGGKLRTDIIPELVQGNSFEELNESLKRAKAVKAAQNDAFAQQLGVKPEQLQEVITNVRKATGADTGAAKPDQKITVPQNAGQHIDSSSAGGDGNIAVPTDMKDYKKDRNALLKEAEKSAGAMTG